MREGVRATQCGRGFLGRDETLVHAAQRDGATVVAEVVGQHVVLQLVVVDHGVEQRLDASSSQLLVRVRQAHDAVPHHLIQQRHVHFVGHPKHLLLHLQVAQPHRVLGQAALHLAAQVLDRHLLVLAERLVCLGGARVVLVMPLATLRRRRELGAVVRGNPKLARPSVEQHAERLAADLDLAKVGRQTLLVQDLLLQRDLLDEGRLGRLDALPVVFQE
mmetsp:Transcript_14407/g.45990  ORF Transcript_14407/g.45990 Transcript_14407/m.45990 type:complete len:218 (-) Transcript_14407:260-913(-)